MLAHKVRHGSHRLKLAHQFRVAIRSFFRTGSYQGPGASTISIPSGTSFAAATKFAQFESEVVTWTVPTPAGHVINLDVSTGLHEFIIFDGFILDATDPGDFNCGKFVSTGAEVQSIRVINCECKNATGQGFLTGGTAGGNEFINCDVHDNGSNPGLDHGIYTANMTAGLIENCDIHDQNFGFGIHIFDGDNNGLIIRGNRIWQTMQGAMTMQSGHNNKVYNNIMFDNSNGGIAHIKSTIGTTEIYNNTFFSNSGFPSVWIRWGGYRYYCREQPHF